MEENKQDSTENEEDNMGSWLQDNFRIVVSIIIVVAIAAGIYSYSKRTQPTTDMLATEDQISEQLNNLEIASADEPGTLKEEKDTETKPVVKQPVTPTAVSQETDGSFVETAGRGDGTTHLARRALANYLEKNPDSTLTPEHKIYIEDYLRKNVGHTGRVFSGTSVEFSKDLIRQAIEQSKNLNDRQLQNLHKYAVRVPSLS